MIREILSCFVLRNFREADGPQSGMIDAQEALHAFLVRGVQPVRRRHGNACSSDAYDEMNCIPSREPVESTTLLAFPALEIGLIHFVLHLLLYTFLCLCLCNSRRRPLRPLRAL